MSFWDSTEDSLGSIYPPKHDTLLEKRSFADTKPSARLTSIACPEQEDVGSEALSLSYQFHDTDDIFKIEDDGKPGDVLRNIEPCPVDFLQASELTGIDGYDSEAEARDTPIATKHESQLSFTDSKPDKDSQGYAIDWNTSYLIKRTDRSATPPPRPSKRFKRESESPISILSPSEDISTCASSTRFADEDWAASHPCADNTVRKVNNNDDHSNDTGRAEAPKDSVDESQAQNIANSLLPYSGGDGGGGGEGEGGGGGSGNEGSRGSGDGDGSDNNISSILPPSKKGKGEPKFACPYQAYEQFRGCLKPARNNPGGGSRGIKRLKQHLSRKHMVSFRCQQCWRAFDSRQKAERHPRAEPTRCHRRERQENEIFMSEEDERKLSNSSHTGRTEVETWWTLFVLLVPGMRDFDIALLQQMYYPYYGPATAYPDIAIVPMATSITENGNELLSNNYEYLQHPPQHLEAVNMPADPNSSMTEEIFDGHNGTGTVHLPPWGHHSTGSDSTGNNNNNNNNNSSTTTMITPASSQLTMTTTTNNTSQHMSSSFSSSFSSSLSSSSHRESVAQRTYDHLLTRYSTLEMVNNNLRSTLNESKGSYSNLQLLYNCLCASVNDEQDRVRRAEGIVRDVLRSPDLPGHLYEKLVKAMDCLALSTMTGINKG